MKNLFFYTQAMDVGYDGRPLIVNIELQVDKGEILTLIGPNGAGKTTILKSITRQLRLLGGKIYIAGKNQEELSGRELARRQAVVLTDRIWSERMTSRDVVSMGRYPYTGTLGLLSREDRERVDEALETVGAMELAERDFLALSDGQRQRILLAKALCQEPELIILDEPTSFLDIKHKMDFLSILRGLVSQGRLAVILSLHELDLAQKISDRVVCVKGAYIDRVGSPEQVFTPEYIQSLYQVEGGSYDSLFGTMEACPTQGKPRIFVIAGGGSGIPVYRRLQRKKIPFATGILSENDLDYHGALLLAGHTIVSPAFEPILSSAYQEAEGVLLRCEKVLCPLKSFGSMNEANQRLRELARERGKLTSPEILE